MNVSALILTLNEEVNLPDCLNSLRWCNDVVVLDSFSMDKTEAIARNWGARFIQRPFDDYAQQRNFGLSEIEYRNNWVLMVDADEVVTPELAKEVQNVVMTCDPDIALFRLRIRYYFMGRWIRHSSAYPTWYGRLSKIGKVSVVRAINEEYMTPGKTAFLREHLLHYPFNKGISNWLSKHDRYSTMEAQEMFQGKTRPFKLADWLHPDPSVRRRALKAFVYSLPARPLMVFILLYTGKRGFLDGKAGLTYCLLKMIYEYMIDCKVRELRMKANGLPL